MRTLISSTTITLLPSYYCPSASDYIPAAGIHFAQVPALCTLFATLFRRRGSRGTGQGTRTRTAAGARRTGRGRHLSARVEEEEATDDVGACALGARARGIHGRGRNSGDLIYDDDDGDDDDECDRRRR